MLKYIFLAVWLSGIPGNAFGDGSMVTREDCKLGEYFDDVQMQCSPCSSLCEVEESRESCWCHCRDEFVIRYNDSVSTYECPTEAPASEKKKKNRNRNRKGKKQQNKEEKKEKKRKNRKIKRCERRCIRACKRDQDYCLD